MKIVVQHKSFYDWKLVGADEVKEGDVAIASVHGPKFKHVQVHYLQPNYTDVVIDDSDIDRMVADHAEAVKTARQGYTAIQEGGPLHGQEVVVAPRNVPDLTREQLIARHLENAVFPFHFPGDAVTSIALVHHQLEDDDAAKLERFLNRRFAQEDEAPKEDKAKGKK